MTHIHSLKPKCKFPTDSITHEQNFNETLLTKRSEFLISNISYDS